jgi:uncharacterized MAPEG superfamily protein
MSLDFICLIILVLWSIPLNHIPAIARVKSGGIAWGMSNREKAPEVSDWVERADRAQRNHHDNLAMIATVIVIAQLTGQANTTTGIASAAILGFRIGHGLAYIAGIGSVRSLCYFGSIIALLVIVWQIFV